MIKTLFKKLYTYFFIISMFVTFYFQTYILIRNDNYNNFIVTLECWFYFLLVYAPFIISLLTSLIIEKKRNENNHKKLFLFDFIINLVLILFAIFYYSLIYIVSNIELPTPS